MSRRLARLHSAPVLCTRPLAGATPSDWLVGKITVEFKKMNERRKGPRNVIYHIEASRYSVIVFRFVLEIVSGL